jgi:2,5-dihydroxypyridine 5,6-dioxygenase
MLTDRIEGKWIDAFCEIFASCAVKQGDTAAILSETQSRALNVELAELALDCTLEGLMHAPETPEILRGGARILVISNEHPEALERMRPDLALERRVRAATKMLRGARRMAVTSAAGTELDVDMAGATTVGVWGWTDRAGTLAHWPGGVVASFPKSGTVNGTLVLYRGDVNLTFKRYLQSPIRLTLEKDYITHIEGEGADCEMRRGYLAAWNDRDAYAVSHVGFGMNPMARYEALAMYDQRDTNGTEIRAVAGNFLFSTGANEFAGRYTAGHFDIPVMKTTITVDNTVVVREGVLQDVFG